MHTQNEKFSARKSQMHTHDSKYETRKIEDNTPPCALESQNKRNGDFLENAEKSQNEHFFDKMSKMIPRLLYIATNST